MAVDDSDRFRRPAPTDRMAPADIASVDLPLVVGGTGEAVRGSDLDDPPTAMWQRDAASGDDPGATPLEPGDVIGTVRLVETIAVGERVTTWRAQRKDGTTVTVHALYAGAIRRERETFQEAATRQDGLCREHPFRGIGSVSRIDPASNAYVVDVAAAGTMDDLPMLSWALPEKLAFFRKLAAAIGAVHASGMVHGCLRPAGVLLDDEELAAVLSEVGTVKLADSFDASSIGHCEYAPFTAPEVRKGQVPDVRSDVYSLGRSLLFLLLDEHPREPDEEVPRLESLVDEPKGLARIVRKCTVRDPTRRYRRVDELLDDLTKYQNHELVGLAAPAGAEADPKEADRERTPAPRAAAAAKPRERLAETVPAAPRPRPRPVAADDEDEPLGRALTVLWAAGIALFVAALLAAYLVGRPSVVFTALAALGALGASLIVPAFGPRPLVSRGLAAVLFVAAVLWYGPTTSAAVAGRRAQLQDGSSEERAAALSAMKERGVADFSGLDFSGVDFSGQDLSFLIFDGASFQGAKLVGTRLEGCSFADADLSRADLSGADLSGVDVTNVIGWDQVRCDGDTVLPARWLCVNGLPQPEAVGGLGLGSEDEAD